MEIKKIVTRQNNKFEIVPILFAGSINGYYLKTNGKDHKANGKIVTFKTQDDAESEIREVERNLK